MSVTLTNKYNLPDTLYKACLYDTHRVAGDLSVTTLIDAPQVRILKRHNNYEEDVSERLYALMGTALHHILERANIEEERRRAFILVAETILNESTKADKYDEAKRQSLAKGAKYITDLMGVFFPEMKSKYIYELTLRLDIDGVTIFGTFDIYDKEIQRLYDYKFCSVFQYIFPEARIKWQAQLNVYAFMLEKEGYPVKDACVVAFFRDWSESGLIKNKDYPPRQTIEIPIAILPMEKIGAYIQKRVELHKKAENGETMLCTGKERWAKADEYAVMTPKSKRALRKFDTEAMAKMFITENQGKYAKAFVEYRPGDSLRCAKFCPVAKFCPQRKEELERQKQQSNNQ